MKRAVDIALAALGVLVVIAAVYVSTHNDSSNAGASGGPVVNRLPSNSAPPTPTGSAASPASSPVGGSSIGGSSTPSTAQPVVAFLGDDWTAGAGTSSKAHRFSTLLTADLHAKQRNFGSNGAGYSTSSSGAYADEVDQIVAAHPNLVVVSGGRNDLSTRHDLTASADDVNQLFRKLRAGLPHAELVAIAPFWGDSDLPAALQTLGQRVKDAVIAVHGTYVDIEDPIHGHSEFMANDADPNDAGHAAIAAALKPKLAALLPS